VRFLCVIPLLLITIATVALSEDDTPVEYGAIKARLINGWNTWNSRNVLSHVLLPEGFTINLALKQHYWIEEKYLAEGLIGRGGENVETFRPGLHSWDGSYTELTIEWEELSAHIQSATVDDDLVVLISPLKESRNAISLIIESGMLWNRPGRLERSGNSIKAVLPARTINVFTTGTHQDDYYVETMSPYLAITLDSTVGICTGRQLSVEEISTIIANARQRLVTAAEQYGKLKDAFLAAQAGIAWNTIYEPKHDRVVSTVGRLWNTVDTACLVGIISFWRTLPALRGRTWLTLTLLSTCEGEPKRALSRMITPVMAARLGIGRSLLLAA
jgi:hypothetical protein